MAIILLLCAMQQLPCAQGAARRLGGRGTTGLTPLQEDVPNSLTEFVKAIRFYTDSRNHITSAIFDSEGSSLIVSLMNGGALFFYDGQTGQARGAERILSVGKQMFGGFALNPDVKWLATGSGNQAVIWPISKESDRPVQVIDRAGIVEALTFSPDSRILASVRYDWDRRVTECHFWDIESSSELQTLSLGAHANSLGVAFSPNGKWLAYGGAGGRLELLKKGSQDKFRSEMSFLEGDERNLEAKVAFSPSGILVSGSHAQNLRVWNIPMAKGIPLRASDPLETGRLENIEVASLAFNSDGALAVAFGDGTIQFWNNINSNIPKMVGFMNVARGIEQIAFNPNGSGIFAVRYSHEIRLWQLRANAD